MSLHDVSDKTRMFKMKDEKEDEVHDILISVFNSLEDKEYNPINQIVGYLLSGDPAYITSHNNARGLIRKFERDDILEVLVKYYLKGHKD